MSAEDQERPKAVPGKNRRLNARDSETQARRKKMGTFLQSLREVQPIIESAQEMTVSRGDFRIHLAKLFHQQQAITKVLAEAWNVSSDLSDAIVLAKLSRASSRVLSLSYHEDDVDVGRVENVAKLLSILNQERRELGELIQENTVSGDILVNVKVVLLTGAMKLQRILNGIGLDYSGSIEHLRWFHQASVILGKDIAFNWDKNSQFKDREVLFQEVVGCCADMVIESWLDAAAKTIEDDKDIMKYQNKQKYWYRAKDAVIENDMGHANFTDESMNAALGIISQVLNDKLAGFNLSLVPTDKRKLFEIGLVSSIDELAVKAWQNAAEKLASSIKSLSEEEYAKWLETDAASNPMPLEMFTAELDVLFSNNGNFIKLSKQQNINAEKISKQQLSILWGLSDAVCRVKSSKIS